MRPGFGFHGLTPVANTVLVLESTFSDEEI